MTAMSDLFSVADKVAVITGGSRGVGRMIALGLVQAGARVYISRISPAAPGPSDFATVLRPMRRGSTSWLTTPARPGARPSRNTPRKASTR
jgi:NAD(P)-dependent dehydrogenase (short-subunit alcohol dehydrogenase family)